METGQATGARGSDRLLWGIVAGAVLLVLAGFGLLLVVRDRQPEQYPEDTPQGVVQRYLTALSEGRFTDAEQYISESVKAKYTEGLRPKLPVPTSSGRSYRVVLQDTRVDGDRATVTVAVSRFSPGGGGLFDRPTQYTDTYVFELRREGGQWRIIWPEYFNPIFW